MQAVEILHSQLSHFLSLYLAQNSELTAQRNAASELQQSLLQHQATIQALQARQARAEGPAASLAALDAPLRELDAAVNRLAQQVGIVPAGSPRSVAGSPSTAHETVVRCTESLSVVSRSLLIVDRDR